MALGTLDRSLPPFFNQGPSVFSKLLFFGTLSLLLIVIDARFQVAQPIRSAIATALYPVQWVALQPVRAFKEGRQYLADLGQAQSESEETKKKLVLQSLRAGQVEQLLQENNRLRQLLELKDKLALPVMAAEVLYDAADPYTRKVIIDRGQAHQVVLGSPVLDESGVVGQVTRVHPLASEVTLVVDRDLAIPVLNVRSGARSVAYGDPTAGGGGMELRFMGSNADVQEGDLLTTSGVDGIYPPGLPVARVSRIEHRAESTFSKIYCVPQALTTGVRHVIVVRPLTADAALPPATDAAAVGPPKKGVAK
jgi:rod shape-determining protein MreC